MKTTLQIIRDNQPNFEKRLRREINNLAMCKRGLKRRGIPELDPFDIINRAIEEQESKLTLGWSGGECSTVCLHMALQIEPNIQVIYNNTGVEFPENVTYVHKVADKWNVKLIEIKPKARFFQVVKEHGWPQIASKRFHAKGKDRKNADRAPMCCHCLKDKERYAFYRKEGITGDISGLRASESRTRAIHIGKMGQIYKVKDQGKDKRPAMTYYVPIALWTIKQVKDYFEKNDLPRNAVYETQTRNGCWPCTAYKGWQANLFRYNVRMLRLIKNMKGDKSLDSFYRQHVEPACGEPKLA